MSLPIASFLSPDKYFDTAIYQEELTKLFRYGPGYVGHEGTVKNIGDYKTLKQEHDARMIVRTGEGVKLVSNICRHRQAIMRRGEGHEKVISCPLHKWTWHNDGSMIGAPHFDENPCMHLKSWELSNWRGLLFAGKRNILEDLKDVGFEGEINFENYRYHHTEYHECHQNWKSFMEVYGDDYHVAPAHPGLGKMVSLKDLQVITGDNWHLQIVESIENTDLKTTPIYEAWRKKCLEQGDGKLPHYGALWFAYYPNVMVEVYPYTITVSTLHPISPTETLNVIEFFYHHDVSKELITAEMNAYMETAIEDDDLAERMDAGRKILHEQAHIWSEDGKLKPEDYAGPYHEPMEIAVKHFHEWYERRIQEKI